MSKVTLWFGVTCLLFACTTNEPKPTELITGQVICRGGCGRRAYYVEITSNHLIGKTQQVFDSNGVNRGQFKNVLVINNLKATDQQENKSILFASFKDTEFSCQSSYPRVVREIEIKY
ncbi:hypothetical protein AHMF7605_20110 [Adhaeribacter arboris]|uniref:Lipoprotein n=1 Tax=Adhaeribacter arboris TaxID=2072846 RepID=A0A2T2YJJ5_9BACT|nr:hypothetical protein [Adhaeribacter arboris]PSR55645.1 hypothetical protein AHMF7605_20110 [Adhaeribacter arboris]